MKKQFTKLTIFFSIAFVLLLFARILFGYYVYAVPVFEVLLTPLLCLCIAAGCFMTVFVTIIVVKACRRDKDDSEKD